MGNLDGIDASTIAALLRAAHFSTGPRAALHRMDPTRLAEPALKRLLAEYFPDSLDDRRMALPAARTRQSRRRFPRPRGLLASAPHGKIERRGIKRLAGETAPAALMP